MSIVDHEYHFDAIVLVRVFALDRLRDGTTHVYLIWLAVQCSAIALHLGQRIDSGTVATTRRSLVLALDVDMLVHVVEYDLHRVGYPPHYVALANGTPCLIGRK